MFLIENVKKNEDLKFVIKVKLKIESFIQELFANAI